MSELGTYGSFTLDDYRTYLTQTVDFFTPTTFEGAYARLSAGQAMQRAVLLRHDIDFSPTRALAMARLEHELSVVATYFVLLTSYTYNALDSEVRDQLRHISELGHEIGLHYDARLGPAAPDDGVRQLAGVMADHLGLTPVAMSFHNPRPVDLEQAGPTVGGLVNAYSQEIFGGFTYVSDSNGYWRFEPWPNVVAARPPNLQVLTHPEWWLDDDDFPGRRWYAGVHTEAQRKWRRYDDDLKLFARENVVGLPADCIRFLEEECPRGRDVLGHWLSGNEEAAYLLLWQTQQQLARKRATEDRDLHPAYARLRQHAAEMLAGDARTGAREISDLVELVRVLLP